MGETIEANHTNSNETEITLSGKSEDVMLYAMDDTDYRWWVDTSEARSLLCYAILAFGYSPLKISNAHFFAIQNAIEGKNKAELTIPKGLSSIYLSLKQELLRRADNGKGELEPVYSYEQHGDGALDTATLLKVGRDTIEHICLMEGIELPEQYYSLKKQHDKVVEERRIDPYYNINVAIKDGKDVDPILLNPDRAWSISTFREIIFGNGNEHLSWQEHLVEKKKWSSSAVLINAFSDSFYDIVETAGRRGEGKFLLNPDETDPEKWQIDPVLALQWCHEKGVLLREQLRNIIGGVELTSEGSQQQATYTCAVKGRNCQFKDLPTAKHPFTHEGKTYCLMHAPERAYDNFGDSKRLHANEISALLYDVIDRWQEFEDEDRDAICLGEVGLDFSHVVFPYSIRVGSSFYANYYKYDSAIHRAKVIPPFDFSGAVFCETVSFNDVEFPQGANFSGTKFLGSASFNGSAFGYTTNFTNATFEADAWFINTEIRTAIFDGIHVKCGFTMHYNKRNESCEKSSNEMFHTSFEGAVFEGIVDFEGREFTDRISFKNSAFHIAPRFFNCSLHPSISFEGVQFLDHSTELHEQCYRDLQRQLDSLSYNIEVKCREPLAKKPAHVETALKSSPVQAGGKLDETQETPLKTNNPRRRGRKGKGVFEMVCEHNRRVREGEKLDDSYKTYIESLYTCLPKEMKNNPAKSSTIEKHVTVTAWENGHEVEYKSK